MPVIKEVTKLWGTELWHHNDSYYCMKTLQLRRGAQSSLHYHKVKRETFLVTHGTVGIQLGGADEPWQTFQSGASVTIEPGVAHRFMALGGAATVVEASTMHDDDDVVRLEPSKLI
jgi:quercetin dioxygenase-like cupin family protein